MTAQTWVKWMTTVLNGRTETKLQPKTLQTHGHCSLELNWRSHWLVRLTWCGLHTDTRTYKGMDFIKQMLDARPCRACGWCESELELILLLDDATDLGDVLTVQTVNVMRYVQRPWVDGICIRKKKQMELMPPRLTIWKGRLLVGSAASPHKERPRDGNGLAYAVTMYSADINRTCTK